MTAEEQAKLRWGTYVWVVPTRPHERSDVYLALVARSAPNVRLVVNDDIPPFCCAASDMFLDEVAARAELHRRRKLRRG